MATGQWNQQCGSATFMSTTEVQRGQQHCWPQSFLLYRKGDTGTHWRHILDSLVLLQPSPSLCPWIPQCVPSRWCLHPGGAFIQAVRGHSEVSRARAESVKALRTTCVTEGVLYLVNFGCVCSYALALPRSLKREAGQWSVSSASPTWMCKSSEAQTSKQTAPQWQPRPRYSKLSSSSLAYSERWASAAPGMSPSVPAARPGPAWPQRKQGSPGSAAVVAAEGAVLASPAAVWGPAPGCGEDSLSIHFARHWAPIRPPTWPGPGPCGALCGCCWRSWVASASMALCLCGPSLATELHIRNSTIHYCKCIFSSLWFS